MSRKLTIEIETLQSGQPRAYADSIYDARITLRVPLPPCAVHKDCPDRSHRMAVGCKMLSNPATRHAVIRTFVSTFDGTKPSWGGQLVTDAKEKDIETEEEQGEVWRATVIHPYTD